MSRTVEKIISEWRENSVRAEADAEELGIDCVYTVEEVRAILDEILAAHKRADEEATSLIVRLSNRNVVLKSALRPVLDVKFVEKRYGRCSGTVPDRDLSGVVLDAQRIYIEYGKQLEETK